MLYDYVFATLAPGRASHDAWAARLQGQDIADAGGEVLGQFFPQLGWASDEAAVLLRWTQDSAARERILTSIAGDAPARIAWRHALTPTLRPASDGARLKPGGIYVHRWFHVASAQVEEFVSLSGAAWPDFEARFDANIFGLFATPSDVEGETSLLLITRYASHGVWEDSRDPTTEAMQLFARRQALTRRTQAASTLLRAG